MFKDLFAVLNYAGVFDCECLTHAHGTVGIQQWTCFLAEVFNDYGNVLSFLWPCRTDCGGCWLQLLDQVLTTQKELTVFMKSKKFSYFRLSPVWAVLEMWNGRGVWILISSLCGGGSFRILNHECGSACTSPQKAQSGSSSTSMRWPDWALTATPHGEITTQNNQFLNLGSYPFNPLSDSWLTRHHVGHLV